MLLNLECYLSESQFYRHNNIHIQPVEWPWLGLCGYNKGDSRSNLPFAIQTPVLRLDFQCKWTWVDIKSCSAASKQRKLYYIECFKCSDIRRHQSKNWRISNFRYAAFEISEWNIVLYFIRFRHGISLRYSLEQWLANDQSNSKQSGRVIPYHSLLQSIRDSCSYFTNHYWGKLIKKQFELHSSDCPYKQKPKYIIFTRRSDNED